MYFQHKFKFWGFLPLLLMFLHAQKLRVLEEMFPYNPFSHNKDK